MKLKIKSRPEDFVVEEMAELPLKKKGGFGAYLLKKNEWNTLELLRALSKKLGMPFHYFSYGGRKDKHAMTCQYIAIQSTKIIELKDKDYCLNFCGFMDRPMGPDLIQGNKFSVTVRKLTAEDINNSLPEIEEARMRGYPNYFDDQRFGSYDVMQGFLAEKLLKGHYNGACKIYMASLRAEERKAETERKKYFYDNWKKWELCLQRASTKFEKKTFDFLVKNPDDFLTLLKQIPGEKLSNYFSTYQAYIWNEVLRKVIMEVAPLSIKVYPGKAGEYLFYHRLAETGYHYLESLTIPTLPLRGTIEDAVSRKVYTHVLEMSGIKHSLFNKLKTRQAFFKSIPRKAIVKPESFAFQVSDDELYSNRKKLLLKFILPRGSYGTMLLKRLFSDSK